MEPANRLGLLPRVPNKVYVHSALPRSTSLQKLLRTECSTPCRFLREWETPSPRQNLPLSFPLSPPPRQRQRQPRRKFLGPQIPETVAQTGRNQELGRLVRRLTSTALYTCFKEYFEKNVAHPHLSIESTVAGHLEMEFERYFHTKIFV